MKFGLNFIPTFQSSKVSAEDYFAQALRLCERADTLGYSSAKTVEHYFHDYGGHSPNPSVLLAAIAARTTKLRLATGAVIPAFNNPIKLAGELAMLDNISHGRLDVGFGRAFIPEEFQAFNVPMDESRARFEEGIALIRQLWTQEEVSFTGNYHHLDHIHSSPKPVQQPHPPMWIASISSLEGVRWAAQQGYYLMIVSSVGGLERTSQLAHTYRTAWKEAEHLPGTEQIQVVVQCYLAESHEQALEGFKQARSVCMDVFAQALRSWQGQTSSAYLGYERLLGAFSKQTWQTSIEEGTALVGTPEEVLEQVYTLQRWYGDVELSLEILFGNMPDMESMRTLELFAQGVMPHFQS
ncbi:LLM class flavin-dependent oxidoreductase [Ktedonobacter robiniae]|uniref:Luciferase n=1 Tax=Ktedonobacter robiniae TaxID=2778365 RepID=A0ABQ3V5V3_9CHLR|nr:LLM class flavin-dependent oxidoreductase [Ktedonobacter robiniae]GHO60005.1 luciferase [Ktedonobacter robiniae]